MAYFVLTVLGFLTYNTACKFIRLLSYMSTLPDMVPISRSPIWVTISPG